MIFSGLKSPKRYSCGSSSSNERTSTGPRRERMLAPRPSSASTATSEFSAGDPTLNVFVGSTTTASSTRVSIPSSDS